MPQLVNFLLFAGGLIVIFVGAAALRHSQLAAGLMVLGVIMMIVGYVSDQRRKKKAKAKEQHDIALRITQLTSAPWGSQQVIKVHGNSWMAIMWLLLGAAGLMVVVIWIKGGIIAWHVVVTGWFFLAVAIIGLPRSFAGLGKPLCELGKDGVATPIHGRIPWSEITGLYLERISISEIPKFFLWLRVEHYQKIVSNPHWTERLLARLNIGAARSGKIRVALTDNEEHPETIYAVARFLWKQSTNTNYEWDPVASNAYNDAAKRAGLFDARISDPEAIRRYASESPERVLAEFEQSNKDLTLMTNERTRGMKYLAWALVVIVIFAVIGLFLRLLKFNA